MILFQEFELATLILLSCAIASSLLAICFAICTIFTPFGALAHSVMLLVASELHVHQSLRLQSTALFSNLFDLGLHRLYVLQRVEGQPERDCEREHYPGELSDIQQWVLLWSPQSTILTNYTTYILAVLVPLLTKLEPHQELDSFQTLFTAQTINSAHINWNPLITRNPSPYATDRWQISVSLRLGVLLEWRCCRLSLRVLRLQSLRLCLCIGT